MSTPTCLCGGKAKSYLRNVTSNPVQLASYWGCANGRCTFFQWNGCTPHGWEVYGTKKMITDEQLLERQQTYLDSLDRLRTDGGPVGLVPSNELLEYLGAPPTPGIIHQRSAWEEPAKNKELYK